MQFLARNSMHLYVVRQPPRCRRTYLVCMEHLRVVNNGHAILRCVEKTRWLTAYPSSLEAMIRDVRDGWNDLTLRAVR